MGAFDRKIRLSYPWRFVAVGFIVIFLMFGTRFSFGLYIKALADNFGASRASISFSQSLYMITYAVVALMAGSIADRIGPKRVLIVGAFFLAGGILLGGSINSVWQYYFSYGVIAAIGSGALYVPVVGAVSKLFTRRRNLALALAASGAGIGQYVIPPLMETIIESHGWQASFYVLGLLILAGGVGVPWALLRGGAVREEMGSGPAESAESRRAGLKGDSGHYSLRQALS
ncbi:MAG TPA: MFS transporter, partial [Thermodesulfobacteriota bacterium]|nr:MFS transporter [Thermodesulfobacteriota bacterium]